MNRNKKPQGPIKPFFARFLEKQDLRDVAGGIPKVTDKWPSDNDELPTD